MWSRDTHLTEDMVTFLKSSGGFIRMTSHVTGMTYQFSIVPSRSGKGFSVNLLLPEGNKYLGYIPKNGHGFASSRLVHTNGSEFPKTHQIFRAFEWMWKHKETDIFPSKCLLTNAS